MYAFWCWRMDFRSFPCNAVQLFVLYQRMRYTVTREKQAKCTLMFSKITKKCNEFTENSLLYCNLARIVVQYHRIKMDSIVNGEGLS